MDDPTPALFQPTYEWTGRLKPKHVAEYRQWMLFVMQTCAQRWNARILYVLGPTPHTSEWWTCEPGEAPKLQQKLNIGIP